MQQPTDPQIVFVATGKHEEFTQLQLAQKGWTTCLTLKRVLSNEAQVIGISFNNDDSAANRWIGSRAMGDC